MALAQKQGYSRGYIISAEKSKDLFRELNEHRPSKEFWDECFKAKTYFNQHTIAKMDELMDAYDESHK